MDKALLAKIRKCLALARSANEHEAAAARASRTVKPPKWEALLCQAVRRALGVIVFLDARGDRTYVGRAPAPEIAAYAFAVLFRQLKAARADYIARHLKRCKPGRKRQRADIFCEGWASSVYRKIADLLPERPEDGLVSQYLAERHPGLVQVDVRGAAMKGRSVWDDWSRGHSAGSKVDLHTGVGGSAAPLMLQ
ncbi:DUF2786 domain-containing protein [Sphingobium lignivorans]|uniref:DUF7168 domain-containing protein n=1 Tax=Sphingobium lignivorans TaxID=2735886 RepID=A0ABR6NMK9_9SPHN|nr:DUF2786 domain-containing protein [Sphingobium lignivorans]MBB5987429.1 hypothetical protein [Sphingobium lignivorans]